MDMEFAAHAPPLHDLDFEEIRRARKMSQTREVSRGALLLDRAFDLIVFKSHHSLSR
jgi:hypothetical protein